MFFILVVLFILKQRFIDRGLRIALWWTRFIPLPDIGSKQTVSLKTEVVSSSTTIIPATCCFSSATPSNSVAAQITSTLHPPDDLSAFSSSTSTSPSLVGHVEL